MRSPVLWIGGKGNIVSRLLKYIPAHKVYVEVFGGGASLLFAKSPSPIEVYNDINSDLVNFFRVLRDEKLFEKFYRKVVFTPYSREEFYRFRDSFENTRDPVERAYKFFVLVRQSFSGNMKSWGFACSTICRGMSKRVSDWLSSIEMLPAVYSRLMRVTIEHDDFRKIIERFDSKDTFFYLDPPYLLDKTNTYYSYRMSEEDHKDLVDIIKRVKGKVMLSGYKNKIYEDLEVSGFQRIDFETVAFSVGTTRSTKKYTYDRKRIESIWINYETSTKRLSFLKER